MEWLPEVRRHRRVVIRGRRGKGDAERGAGTDDTLGRQDTSVRLHDAVTDAETKPRAGAFRLGPEEVLEDALLNFPIQSGAPVPDLDADPAPLVTRPDRQLPYRRAGHRVLGVHDEVEQHLLKLPVVAADTCQPGVEMGFDR